ncbi:MAG: 30S ribosome-binding factor RbfA [Alphaproteobacteria bacterium]|nr:30S ribosome-binding factor RbfA [Alphaproteobacteria bacterium]
MNKQIFNNEIIKSNKAQSNRTEKIAKEIKVILSEVFTKSQLKDALLFDKIVLISEVKVNGDISLAKVYVSNWNVNLDDKLLITTLNKYIPFFRSKIAKALKIKTIPDLAFFMDDQLNKIIESEKMFKSLEDTTKNNDS